MEQRINNIRVKYVFVFTRAVLENVSVGDREGIKGKQTEVV